MQKIVCLVGESGSGKTTLETSLSQIGYNKIISYTSRPKREEEIEGVDYHFVTSEEFLRFLEEGALLEHTLYNGNYYGAVKPLESGKYVIVVEPEGARVIKSKYGDNACIIYLHCSVSTSFKRLQERGMSMLQAATRVQFDKARFYNFDEEADCTITAELSKDDVLVETLECLYDF